MSALADLFDSTMLLLPVTEPGMRGELALTGKRLRVNPLTRIRGTEMFRKLMFPFWVIRNLPTILGEIRRADAVHVPIPGDVGTIGMLLAYALGKPLFVRYCGNWFVQTTVAEHFWKWFMERSAGGRNVMMATGGDSRPPSQRNPAARWIFSTTLTLNELREIQRARARRGGPGAQLITVCRQEVGKGTELIIDSMGLIRRTVPGAHLHIVGDGDALPALKERAATSGAAEHITFHGSVDHETVIRLLGAADLFCYPTATEGFPKAVLEALACGLPVVTTKVSVLPHLVSDCGVLLDIVTPDALAQAVSTCLSEPDAYEAMSLRAMDRAQAYSLERWRDTIGDTLRAAWGPLQSHV